MVTTDEKVPQPARVRLSLETERLLLRAWVPEDTGWHRHLVVERGGGMPTAEDDAAVVAGLLTAEQTHGVVPSVVVRREDNDVLGYCGLVVGRASVAEPELAYELFARVHGRGYATEAASAVIAAARETGRERIWSTVRPWNAASFRVLAKLGFRRDRSTWDDRGEVVWNVLDL